MVAILALVLQVLMALVSSSATEVMVIPPSNSADALMAEYESGCACDDCYWTTCYLESLSEFDAMFNSYEVKRAKNNALMIRRGNSGSYKFAKRGM